MNINKNLFDALPIGFFNCLASGSSNRIYSDCLLLIYHEYDREITYRIARSRIRDALAIYLLENHIDYLDDEMTTDRNYNQLANSVIRKFCSKEVGWLEEDTDDATYEKHIMMTEQGVFLAEFLQKMMKPEWEEFSSYIFNIYNILQNPDQWEPDIYVNALRSVYRNAKQLSGALKRLATFIKKIIERMVREESLESLTENVLEYCEGDFIREYARLTKQQNIHMYRSFIRSKLEAMQNRQELFEGLVAGCAKEEELEHIEAENKVLDMIQTILQFFSVDYDEIMRDIKHKINIYLQIAIGRARFLQNRDSDVRGHVEQTIRVIAAEMNTLGWKEELPESMNGLFLLENNEFIDTDSIRYPRREQMIREATYAKLEEMTQEDIDRAREAQEREAENPYSKDKMKNYLEALLGDRTEISSEEVPMKSKRDLLSALSAVEYTSSEKDMFQKSVRRLLKQTFIVRDRDEDSKKAYYFVSKRSEPFSAYLGYIGYDIVIDRENGVIMLQNCRDLGENGKLQINHVTLKKMESVVLCCLWTLYADRVRSGSLSKNIEISVTDLRYEMEKYGIRDQIDKSSFASILTLFTKYQLLQVIGKFGEEDCRICLYPSMQFVLEPQEFGKFVENVNRRMQEKWSREDEWETELTKEEEDGDEESDDHE